MTFEFITESGRQFKLAPLRVSQVIRMAKGRDVVDVYERHEILRQVIADSIANAGEAISAAELGDLLTLPDMAGMIAAITKLSGFANKPKEPEKHSFFRK
jgi:hypothetical protein